MRVDDKKIEMESLTRLDKSWIEPAADLLARAFQDDPLWKYFFQNESNRPYKLFHMFHMLVRYAVLSGEVYATSSNLEGVVVWLPSNRADMTPWQMVRSGGFLTMLKMSGKEFARSMRYTDFASDIHKQHTPYPHWYLQFIGVDPIYQGQGFAGKLLKPMLARLNLEGLSCFLETQNRENVPLYEHYGFQVVEEDTIPGTDIGHWAMLR